MVSDLSKITGQDKIASEIVNEVGNNKKKLFLIKGNDGYGKTYICNYLKSKFVESNFISIIVEPNKMRGAAPHSCYFEAVKDFASNYTNSILKILSIQGSKDIPFVSNTVSSLIETLYKRKEKNRHLTETEKNIFTLLDHVFSSKRSVIMFDSIDMLSDEDLSIANLLINRIPEYDFISKISIIITYSDESILDSLNINKYEIQPFIIKKAPVKYAKQIFTLMNSKIDISEQKAIDIFVLTDSNLHLVKDIAMMYNENLHTGMELDKIFYNILENIVNKRCVNPDDFIEFITKASLLGIEFDESVLKIFYDKGIQSFYENKSDSLDMGILYEKYSNLGFKNLSAYHILINAVELKDAWYYIQLEQCIRLCYPLDYESRIYALNKANHYRQSDILKAVHYLYCIRAKVKSNKYKMELLESIINIHIKNITVNLSEATFNYLDGNYTSVFKKLQNINCEEIFEIKFELEYLESIAISNSTFELDEFRNVIEKMNIWYMDNLFRQNEPEMWLRSATILLELYSETNQYEKVNEIYTKIQQFYNENIKLDYLLQKRNYMLKAKANVYSKIELAYINTYKAVLYFSKIYNSFYDNMNLYISLVNHSGNCIVLAKYNEAYENCLIAFELVEKFKHNNFMKLETLINNYIICSLQLNKINLKKAIELLEQLIDSVNDIADKCLLQNNLVTLYYENSDCQKSRLLSSQLLDTLHHMNNVDDYYSYFIYNNILVLEHLFGNSKVASSIYTTISNLNPSYLDRYYFKRRNEIIKEFLADESINLNENQNDYLLNKYPNEIGEAWSFWGKLFLLSELQIWSDC